MNLALRNDPVGIMSEAAAASETIRVLMIDDDVQYSALCARYLKSSNRANFTVTFASSAAEGFKELDKAEFDCLLVDYLLPDLTGTEVVRALRDFKADPYPPTVIMTAQGGESAAAEAVRAGAMDFLPKRTVTATSLVRAITNAVQKNSLRKSMAEQSSKLRRANQELKTRNEEIQRFYQVVSHEVKTPLAAAREFIAITLDGIAGPVTAYQTEMLTYALESCDQISAHFNDLIETTRLESKKMVLNKELTALDEVVTRLFASMSSAVDSKKVFLKKRLLNEIPPFWFDCNRVIQVLSNLLGNAIKYTEPGGTITMAVRHDREAEVVEIAISDEGCGIAPEDLERIFDRLYQVGGTGDDFMGAGLGLGLSIAREIVQLHDGDLTAQSVVGEGSTFTVRLPSTNPLSK